MSKVPFNVNKWLTKDSIRFLSKIAADKKPRKRKIIRKPKP